LKEQLQIEYEMQTTYVYKDSHNIFNLNAQAHSLS